MTRNPLPSDLQPASVTAVIDPREQLPFDLSPLKSVAGTLSAGDYSVLGLENHIAIERKSLGDFVACCGVERERFEREIQRLLGYQTRAVVIEAGWADLEAGNWRSAIRAESVVSSALGWIAAGIPIVCAGDRPSAQRYTAKILFIAARRRYREARSLVGSVLAKDGSEAASR